MRPISDADVAQQRTRVREKRKELLPLARAFGVAWNAGDEKEIRSAAITLIEASGEALPMADPSAPSELIRLRGCRRGFALTIYDYLRPEVTDPAA